MLPPFFFFFENCFKLFNSASEILSPCLFSGGVFGVEFELLNMELLRLLIMGFFSLDLLSRRVFGHQCDVGSSWHHGEGGSLSSPLPCPLYRTAPVAISSRRFENSGGSLPVSSFKYAWQRVLIPASNICSELCGGQMAGGDILLRQDTLP